MKYTIFILGLGLVGYLVGNGLGKTMSAGEVVDDKKEEPVRERSREGKMTKYLAMKSSDTVATLSEVPGSELHDRLALWLVDATPEDFQDFWPSYLERTDRTNDLNNLVFIFWMKVDPEAAIEVAMGTEFARYPFWAWACHDPEKALNEAMARYGGTDKEEPIGNAAWGVGEFHPQWMMDNLERLDLPSWLKDRVLSGYIKWPDAQNPRESIEFLKKEGRNISLKTVMALAREDVDEAYEVVQQLQNSENYRYREMSGEFFRSLRAEDPAVLDQLAAHLKSPNDRMKLDVIKFETLLETNPELAREEIASTQSRWTKQDKQILLPEHYLENGNREAAVQLLDGIYELGDPTSRRLTVIRENGKSSSGVGNQRGRQFLMRILGDDPGELISGLPKKGENSLHPAVPQLVEAWSQHNLDGLAEWTREQDDPDVYRAAAETVMNGLNSREDYENSTMWAASLAGAEQNNQRNLYSNYSNWEQQNPEEARAWFAEVDLPTESREYMEKMIKLNLRN